MNVFETALEKLRNRGNKDHVHVDGNYGEAGPPRAVRRERSVKRFRQYRDVYHGELRFWEWKPTQTHPGARRIKNRRRNKQARASRKANR